MNMEYFMPCFSPLQALRLNSLTASGKRAISILKRRDASKLIGSPDLFELPCGQCIGCRLERSRQWAMRCVHESRLYSANAFITLTFNPESLIARSVPESLDVRDFQLFMKRLRKRFCGVDPIVDPNDEDGQIWPIRFFHCGEYGDLSFRPHYHACLFNFDFPDKTLWKTVNGNRLYTSAILDDLWGKGFCTIGDVTFDSAAYVARYIMKKVTGPTALDHYSRDGIVLKPEYVTMSRRPGIGKLWFDSNWRDVYINGGDSVVMNGLQCNPPRYYDTQYEFLTSDLDSIKSARLANAEKHASNNTPDRLFIRERIKNSRISLLPRNVE